MVGETKQKFGRNRRYPSSGGLITKYICIILFDLLMVIRDTVDFQVITYNCDNEELCNYVNKKVSKLSNFVFFPEHSLQSLITKLGSLSKALDVFHQYYISY
jgi:hypothetical protein